MKLSRRQLPSLLDALLHMDGSPQHPSKFTPKVRYALAKNLRLLSARFEDIEKARIGLIRELSPKTLTIDPKTEEAVTFTVRWEEFLDAEAEEINLMRFTLSDLNLDANDLPIAVLSKLGPLLIEDGEPAPVAP